MYIIFSNFVSDTMTTKDVNIYQGMHLYIPGYVCRQAHTCIYRIFSPFASVNYFIAAYGDIIFKKKNVEIMFKSPSLTLIFTHLHYGGEMVTWYSII